MDRRSKAVLSLSVVLTLALLVPAGALAKGKPPTETSNNLSVPVIIVGGGALTGVNAPTDEPSLLLAPTGTPATAYPIDPDAFYYVQRLHKWQAQAYSTSATTVEAKAGWGDNLTGDAKLKVGSPIRVELGLLESTGIVMDGYIVDKLEPDKLDRESAYGTPAASGETNAAAFPTSFPNAVKGEVRVYDPAATFSIQKVEGGAYVVPPGTPAKAEINAGGAVIYGYSLRVSAAGEYRVTYVTPNVTLTGTDGGTFEAHSVSLVITVVAGGGGGGRK
ncbi:MAG: hypothetical protein QG587_1603 [Chloroflexota bacterium]|nr:hypothetical protein [Chloroflexota bacterium]